MNLPESFFKEEIIDDTLVSQERKRVWAVCLDLLEKFAEFCEKHKLRWYMGFGTLLGAVRYQGFIPWDDDVDVMMPREDFEKLRLLYREVKPPYFLQNSLSDKDMSWQEGRMCFRNENSACIFKYEFERNMSHGIRLDINALDACPDTYYERERQGKKIQRYQKMLFILCNSSYHPNKRMFHFGMSRWQWGKFLRVAQSKSKEEWEELLFKECTMYRNDEAKYCSIFTSYSYSHGITYPVFRTEDFKETRYLPFENLLLPVPAGYWQCLTKQYGKDFLCRVPLEFRHAVHSVFWDVDESYVIWRKRFREALHPSKERQVILFGAGHMVQSFLRETRGKIRPIFCVDNDPKKWGGEVEGLLVKSPEILKEIPAEKLHIIICNNYFRQIGRQLKEMGITEYYVYTDNFDILFGSPDLMAGFEAKPGKPYRIGYVQGTFDLFHIGHLNLLRRAKEQCDYLIAGVVTDELSEHYKNKCPYIPYEERAEIVKCCKYVNRVIKVDFKNEDKRKICRECHFDVHFSGDDHTDWQELKADLKKMGADIVFFPYTQGISSTKLQKEIKQGRSGDAK